MQKLTYPKSHRLAGKLNFAAVYDGGTKASRGPIVMFARPNQLAHPRLGLSVSRRVGTAPRRNVIKRRLRESFRLSQHDWPAGYDVILVVRPHAPLPLAEYQRILIALMVRVVKNG